MARKTNCLKNGKYAYFRKTKTIGHDINGEPIKKDFYGKGETDTVNKIKAYEKRLDAGLQVGKEKQTIEQLMHYWLFNVRLYSSKSKSASFEKDEGKYRNYIKKSDIRFLSVYTITTQPIQEWYNELYKNGTSSNVIFEINKTLRSFFTYCKDTKIISDNPCSLRVIQIPGNADEDGIDDDFDDDEKVIVFDDEEQKKIVDAIKYEDGKDNTFNMTVQLGLVTGLRKGEILGLQKKYVDLERCVIKVRKTLKNVKEFKVGAKDSNDYVRKLKLITPKSKSSIRTVPFPKELVPTLKKYFKEQEEKYKKLGLKFNDDSLIFTTSTGNMIESSNHRKQWIKFLDKLGIPYRKFHAIRDTFATTLIRKKVSLFDVKDLLGHSSITITEKYYIYCYPKDKSYAVALLSNFVQS